jgi:hypothetical protein
VTGLYICGILGVVCRSWNNGREILSPPVWEPTIEKVAKYGIGKRSVGLIFANILKFVIDIPLPGKIFSACISRNFGCCLQVAEQCKGNLEPACREPAREKFGKYGIGKWSVEFVFANILIFVIDIPLPGRIFSACFWTSCVGTVIMMVSSRHGELSALNLSYCILGKKCEGGGHMKQ